MTLLFDAPATPTIPLTGQGDIPVRRIFCVGRNYAAHAAEMNTVVDREAPFYFTKSPQHVVASGATVPYPTGTQDCHHEMELALAIGKAAFRIGADQVADVVLGYGCALDMTRRDLQAKSKADRRPWDTAKDYENAAVFAPMTPAGDVGDIASCVLHLDVNGARRQQAPISDMIHSVTDIVVDLSKYYHLQPGDIIMTGTPAGVGPVQPGDVLDGGIDGLQPIRLTIGEPE